MSRKHDETVVSRHIEVFESDWEFLQQQFGRASEAKLGVSVAIRQMIRKGVRDYQERLARKLDRLRGDVGAATGTMPSLDRFFVPEGANKAAQDVGNKLAADVAVRIMNKGTPDAE
jgi:hypothetical protein